MIMMIEREEKQKKPQDKKLREESKEKLRRNGEYASEPDKKLKDKKQRLAAEIASR
jgi:hypothetical protein